MFDIKSFLQRGVEKQLIDVEDYIFMPQTIQLKIDDGDLKCVLNSDGRVDVFYTKQGVTDVRSAARKHPLTSFETELHHGIYDDVIEDLISDVNDTIHGRSRYFRNVVLPKTPALNAPKK